jgi:hypothetical protein
LVQRSVTYLTLVSGVVVTVTVAGSADVAGAGYDCVLALVQGEVAGVVCAGQAVVALAVSETLATGVEILVTNEGEVRAGVARRHAVAFEASLVSVAEQGVVRAVREVGLVVVEALSGTVAGVGIVAIGVGLIAAHGSGGQVRMLALAGLAFVGRAVVAVIGARRAVHLVVGFAVAEAIALVRIVALGATGVSAWRARGGGWVLAQSGDAGVLSAIIGIAAVLHGTAFVRAGVGVLAAELLRQAGAGARGAARRRIAILHAVTEKPVRRAVDGRVLAGAALACVESTLVAVGAVGGGAAPVVMDGYIDLDEVLGYVTEVAPGD